MNKTVESINKICGILTSVNTKIDPENRKIELQQNIDKFKELKLEYQSQLRDNFDKMSQYLLKYKEAKQSHSKQYFVKKIDKYKSACTMLFERANNTQSTIDRLTILL